jgi:small subunit ribosomal protein S16
VAVRIRLKRTGRKNLPSFRICVFDGRTRRDGPPIETVGWFNPLMREAGKGFKAEAARIEHWIGRGAKMTLAVTQLLAKQGVKLTLPVKGEPPAKKPAKKKTSKTGKPDAAAVERRKRKLLKRASRRAHVAKKAAAAKAAADKKAAPAAEPGKKE